MMTKFSTLSRNDQQAICNILHLPLPTPNINLDMIIAQEKIQPADILVRLERSRNLNAMIAAAAIRGGVKHCPADPRLNPKPYPKAPVATPKTTAEETRKAAPVKAAISGGTNRTLLSFAPNPKRIGSAARDRYAKYQIGKTENELLELGLWRSDFRHDTQHKFVTWAD